MGPPSAQLGLRAQPLCYSLRLVAELRLRRTAVSHLFLITLITLSPLPAQTLCCPLKPRSSQACCASDERTWLGTPEVLSSLSRAFAAWKSWYETFQVSFCTVKAPGGWMREGRGGGPPRGWESGEGPQPPRDVHLISIGLTVCLG